MHFFEKVKLLVLLRETNLIYCFAGQKKYFVISIQPKWFL